MDRWNRAWGAVAFIVIASCDRAAPPAHGPESALGMLAHVVRDDATLMSRIAPTEHGFSLGEHGRARIEGTGRPNELRASLPALADGAVDLGFEGTKSLDVRLTLQGAHAAAAALDHGRAIYRGAFFGTDRVLLAGLGSVEELFVLRDEQSPRSFTWSVATGDGITRVAKRGHDLAFETTGGRAVLSIPRPFAVDARGTHVDLDLVWNDAARTFRIELPESPLAYPVVIDPVFQSWGWLQSPSTPNPGALDDIAMVYDSARSNVVLWAPATQKTWTWSGTWSQLTTATSPPAQPMTISYDETRLNVVALSDSGSTWTWNGTDWTQKSPTVLPGSRPNSRMAYDGNSSKVLLFGGTGANNDTFLWDGTNWSKPVVASPPPARNAHGMAWDPEHRRVVLFGGSGSGGYLNDTWLWNGSTWTAQAPPRSPSGRREFGMTFDSLERKVITVTGFFSGGFLDDAWAWDGSAWLPLDQATQRPQARSGAGFTHDFGRHANLLFGGTGFFTDTWLFYRLGAACSTNADCPGAFCTDGVCCGSVSCGTCQSCNGSQIGVCSYVNNAEDADTCAIAQGKSCSALGDCKLANGQQATNVNDCASGIIVDGVCCNTRCEGTCQACRADLKESGSLSGTCDNARAGTDKKSQCASTNASTCGLDGTCDGKGACRVYPSGSACGQSACVDNRATGRVCDGAGKCIETVGGVACGFYACIEAVGCKTRCENNADCNERNHCEDGRCIPDEGASCDGKHTVVSPDGSKHDCAPYNCEGSLCRTRCQSVADCVFPAQCTNAGLCVAFDQTKQPDQGGGCSLSRRSPASSGGGAAGLACAAAFVRSTRRRRARRGQSSAAVGSAQQRKPVL